MRTASPKTLIVKVVSGQNGVNIVNRRTAVTPVVQVLNQDNVPVAGALVDFASPDDGAGLKFSNGDRSTSAVTEMDGKASPAGILPVDSGKFQIAVTATYGDALPAVVIIDQTNYETAADASKAGATVPILQANASSQMTPAKRDRLSNGAITGIVLAIAGGAALGILLGLKHWGKSSSTATIGIGSPTVGAP